MDDILRMGVLQPLRDFLSDPHRLLDWKLAFSPDQVAQTLPRHIRHDVEEQPLGASRVMDWQDVGVNQTGRNADFPEKSAGTEGCSKGWAQDLDGDKAVVLQVPGQVNCGHASAA